MRKQNSLLVFRFSALVLSVELTSEDLSLSQRRPGRFLRWSKMAGDKDNDVSAGELDEQWPLPKWENSTLDVNKKTDFIP